MSELPCKRKFIDVALPLEAMNVASAREKSIRHGHPSTLHLRWARRSLAACRVVLFPTQKAQEAERRQLFDIIERFVRESTTNEAVLSSCRSAREMLVHLASSPDVELKLEVHIAAQHTGTDFDHATKRTVSENTGTLKFRDLDWEEE